jgi:serine/threonine-protein kinase
VLVAVVGWLIYGFLDDDGSTASVTVRNVVLQPEAEARAQLREQGLEVRIERRANDRIPKGVVAAQDPEAGAIVDEGTTVVLTVSDGRGTRDVPDVAGQTLEEAQRILMEQGFTTRVREEASDDIDEGTVIRTQPRAGREAEIGSEVVIVVSAGPEPVTVPDVVGQDQVAATQTLARAGFVVDAERQSSSSVPSGTVIGTDPPAGATARKGDRVRMVVSTGPEQVTVPSVVGQTQAAATSTLQNQGFDVDVLTVPSTPANAGRVISQSPTAGNSANRGSTVTITVGASTPTSTTSTTA